MAKTGVLGTLSASLSDAKTPRESAEQWLPLVSQQHRGHYPSGHETFFSHSLDSLTPGVAGRSAAALAATACRELGYARAVVVQNCASLLLLEQEDSRSNFSCSEWVSEYHLRA